VLRALIPSDLESSGEGADDAYGDSVTDVHSATATVTCSECDDDACGESVPREW